MGYRFKKTIRVYCGKCQEFVDEERTEFINIEEDFQGRDLLTFICPDCNTQQRAYRVG